MPSRQLPASIRYLKAQLRILQRPAVWVSASVLLVAIVSLAETWNNPERFTAPSQPSGAGLSGGNPDAAVPVRPTPLDPLSSVDEPLFGVTTQPSPVQPSSSTADGLTNSNPADSLTSPLLLPRSSTSRSTASPLAPDPFASIRTGSGTSTGSGSGSGGSSGGSTINPYAGSGVSGNMGSPFSSGSSDRSSDSTSSNPLQSSPDRYAAPSTTAQPSSSPSSQSNSLAPGTTPSENNSGELPAPMSASPGQSSFVQPQPLPGQPSYGQTQPQPQFVPQTSPAPGTTGYTMPPAFRTNANTSGGRSFGNYNNAPSGVPTTGFSSSTQPGTSMPTVQPQGSQPQAPPAPFSVPRATPGQSIGGGQINTFSNP